MNNPIHALTFAQVVAIICASLLLATAGLAQSVSFEALQRDGYGMVPLQRPRSNILTVDAEIDGRRARLLVDTGWTGEGVSLHGEALPGLPLAAQPALEFRTSARGDRASGVRKGTAGRVLLGNVQLAQVPVFVGSFARLADPVARRAHAANGIVGVQFLRTCSAILDLQNLRLYLRPPGKGRRAVISGGLRAAGLAEVPFQQTAQNDCLVPVEVNGFRGNMVVDTGTYHAVIDARLAKINARPFGTRRAHPRPETSDEFQTITRIDARSREAAAFTSNAPVTPLQSFKIGNVAARAPDIRLAPFGALPREQERTIGLLGIDILGGNGAILDFGERKLYFLPAR
jgi:hypothetical protein